MSLEDAIQPIEAAEDQAAREDRLLDQKLMWGTSHLATEEHNSPLTNVSSLAPPT